MVRSYPVRTYGRMVSYFQRSCVHPRRWPNLFDCRAAYVEPQDLAGLDRERVVGLGSRFLVDAQGETV